MCGPDINKTNVPSIRVAFRYELLSGEMQRIREGNAVVRHRLRQLCPADLCAQMLQTLKEKEVVTASPVTPAISAPDFKTKKQPVELLYTRPAPPIAVAPGPAPVDSAQHQAHEVCSEHSLRAALEANAIVLRRRARFRTTTKLSRSPLVIRTRTMRRACLAASSPSLRH